MCDDFTKAVKEHLSDPLARRADTQCFLVSIREELAVEGISAPRREQLTRYEAELEELRTRDTPKPPGLSTI
jgi:hypothetical protein